MAFYTIDRLDIDFDYILSSSNNLNEHVLNTKEFTSVDMIAIDVLKDKKGLIFF